MVRPSSSPIKGNGLPRGGHGSPRSPRHQARSSSLERKFVCFALAAIVALLSYAVLYTRYDVSRSDGHSARTAVETSLRRHGGDRRTHRASRGEKTPRNDHEGWHERADAPKATMHGMEREFHNDAEPEKPMHVPEQLQVIEEKVPPLFTPVDEQRLHNGRVVRELSHRILSRNIAQSNVVIISPKFRNALVVASGDGLRRGGMEDKVDYPARVAMDQGHATHILPPTTALSEGWRFAGREYNATSVGWVLLAYFSTQTAHHSKHTRSMTIDDILTPSKAGGWLQRTTVTYMVFPVRARAFVPLSSILDREYEYEMGYTANATVEITGLVAAETLLGRNYKLQLLASSHHFDADDEGGEGFDYGPNALFQSVKALHRFLYERVTRILRLEAGHIGRHHRRMKSYAANGNQGKLLEVEFHSLLFATQGLDLAIPARSSYVDVGNHKECQHPDGKRKKRCDPKLNPRALNDAIFPECPKRHKTLTVQFVDKRDLSGLYIAGAKDQDTVRERRVLDRTMLEKTNGIMIDVFGENWLKEADVQTGEIEVWAGNREDPSKSEAVCVKADRSALLPRVACTTRILPANLPRASPELKERPNLLVVMIDPLSRMQLRRSLPNTWALLELLGFVDFPLYTAVGNNSGPNQAALYSGTPLAGRQDIRSSNSSTARSWLWDRLNGEGYVTMKAEDGCISNSNMVQSIRPQTHHGKELHEMFCFSHDRPNCLGGKMAAQHLVDYARQFIRAYDGSRPWAAFLSFIDSHEDSLTLASYLDGVLLEFLQEVPKNTMIAFLSDHGLHYGPTFASKSGEVERAQPLLYMRMPTFKKVGPLQRNAQNFVTAFDVHETILDVLLGEKRSNQMGMSLMEEFPKSRTQCGKTSAIPSNVCSLLKNAGRVELSSSYQCTFMRDPPSVFSFYSDIPQTNRPRWPKNCPLPTNHSSDNGPCFCATSSREWFDCSHMSRADFQGHIESDTDHFSLRSCGNHNLDQSLELNIHVKKNDGLVTTRNALTEKAKKMLTANHPTADVETSLDAQPNIIFLEVDSVALSFSERFFPKTWSLLRKHKIVTEKEGSSCPTGWCAGIFNHSSVVGQSSIVNQLAALSGCIDYNDKDEDLKHYNTGKTTHCPAGGNLSFGLGQGGVRQDHWLFDVAKNLGYLTFFGEEFCYEDSPYVVQKESVFTLDADLALDKLFCHLAKDWLRVNGQVNSQIKTWAVEHDSKAVPDSCFDGRSRSEIGLEVINQMWNAYDLPKFAFLNALAAHDYSLDAAHASLGAENYDGVVYRFLSSIMARKDSRDTYIFLRSDHGLQGGPYPVDYSTQIEHMHPWTAVIAPAGHQSLSIGHLSSNQNRLASGFDMYHSIRYLMSPSSSNSEKNHILFDAGIPPWSYNLFRQTIPSNRSCKDAKIPRAFCPCIGERTDMAPNYYVGQSEQSNKKLPLPVLNYNWRTTLFQPTKLPGVQTPKDEQYKYDVSVTKEIVPPKCNATLGSYIDEKMLGDSWLLVDNITSSLYQGSDVSGGIFLYPRQSILLSYLVQHEATSRAAKSSGANKDEPFRVCETGFGSGHSAALFLSAAPNVEVVSFDKFNRPYQTANFMALRGYFGKRLTRVIGNSCNTVKSYPKRCDFLHGSSLCRTDNIDLINKSGAGVTLTSTAMDSLEDSSVYFGKTPQRDVEKYGEHAQWGELLKKRCIEKLVCFREEERTLDAKLYLARGEEQKISHKFCFAVNTGTCGNKKHIAVESTWHTEDFCPDWIVAPQNLYNLLEN